MADHESLNSLHESHELFKREHDEQLVQWMNRRPDDWTLSAGGSGTIYGWGHNHRGQLGGIEGAKVKVPTPTEALATLRPVQLIGGEQTLFAVTADGKVFQQLWRVSDQDRGNVSSRSGSSAVRDRIRRRGPTGHRGHRVCVHPHPAGVHPARLHQESSRELRGEALPGPVLGGRSLLLGGGGGREAGPREQKVGMDSDVTPPTHILF